MADNFEDLGFKVEVEGANDAISRLDKIIERLDKLTDTQERQSKESKNLLNIASSFITKTTTIIKTAKSFGNIMKNAVDESSKYIENLNLFAVSFGESYKETLNWALNLSNAYGLANNEIIKFAGTFRELSNSLGIVGDTAESVSTIVTKLGYDLSALFNTTVESAMQKLQSGVFTGNVRPLRAYGIDISQNQIDALFKTNEELAKLGINANKLSQSDKVLARLLITLQSANNSFGTMAREINNLQSQLRILQGSWENFKLAVGDLIAEPFKEALIWINAFLIGITDVIRAFVPLQKEDKTPVSKINDDAEEASEAIDNLNGKLATFDKFNVLGGQSSGNSSISATEILNKLLKEQASLYDEELAKAMKETANEAVVLSKQIRDFFIIVNEKGNFVDWTDNIKAFIDQLKLLSTTLIILGTGKGALSLMKFSQDFTLNLEKMKLGANATKEQLKELSNEAEVNAARMNNLTASFNMAVIGITSLVSGIMTLAQSWGKMDDGQRIATIFVSIAAAITAAAVALKIFQGNWAMALGIAGTVAGAGLTIGSTLSQIKGYANGGYSNANLIMTHENGKREWVGKAAGSSAIVNDTQMSDIMESAVAKGVYRALDANAQSAVNAGRTNNIYKFNVNGRELLYVIEDEAKKQGKSFQRG